MARGTYLDPNDHSTLSLHPRIGFLSFLHFPRKKIVSFLDACDAALDPVYVVLEAGLATWLHGIEIGS